MADARVLLGDCIATMATLEAESIDAFVTDPPYELNFMGRGWDNAGVSFRRETWEAATRLLKPGGHLLAFGAPRTYHRMACAIEDAGFEIRDSLHWIYASGFPKSLDVAKAIDKSMGAEREVIGVQSKPGIAKSWDAAYSGELRSHAAVTEDGQRWQGWGTALKPAHEPIVMARKPLSGTVAETVLAHGTGALNIDATRLGREPGSHALERPKTPTGGVTNFPPSATLREPVEGGRWPANILLSHLETCEGSGPTHTDVLCSPGCPVHELNEASGQSVSRSAEMPLPTGHAFAGPTFGGDSAGGPEQTVRGFNDVGGAARFFYVAKPRRRERIGGTIRNLHVTVKPVLLMQHLVRLVTPPGGVVLDPFMGSGTTGCAAMAEGFGFIGIENDPVSHETSLARIADYAFAHGRERPTTE